jgi:hypothetical protein
MGSERGLTRREVLAGAAVAGAALSARVPASRAAGPAPAGAAEDAVWRHGGALAQRGVDIASVAGREAEGRFGLMFKKLPGYAPPDEALVDLARRMTEPAQPGPGDPLGDPRLPAGFTFFGQFIDHDLTFDQTPLGTQQVDPHGLTNFDTARFDLASVYGLGPQGSPELYDATSAGRLRLVRPLGIDDLPRRADGSAYLGDPRNDENLILCQLHIAFIKFHNRLVAEGHDFADAQRLTQWHFQWLVVHDYLEHVVGKDTVERFLDESNGRIKFRREYYKPKNPNRPMMPIEYAVAAFRFGHSMVRAGYLLNIPAGGAPIGAPIFANPPSEGDLHGSRPIPARLKIDWREFFAMPGADRAPANLARPIDTKLSPPLHDLPPSVVPPDVQPVINDLAQRNLLRGKRVGLPAGQDVAQAMGITPLANRDIGLPEAAWNNKAPLWYYVLAEAERLTSGLTLGPVGGRIVAETILGIIDTDKDSYFHQRDWQPMPPAGRTFGIGDFLAFAAGPGSRAAPEQL